MRSVLTSRASKPGSTACRRCAVRSSKAEPISTTIANAITTQQWEHVAVVVDRTNGAATVVIDGAIATTDNTIRNDFSTTSSIEIGRMKTNNVFDGLLDEVEIASTLRSLEWIQTAYKNQRAPMDFYTVAPEQAHP